MKQIRNGRAKAREPHKLSPARARKAKWEADAVTWYMKGYNMADVREKMIEQEGHNFSLSWTKEIINKAIKECVERKNDLIANHIAVELEKINRLEQTYTDAWERSRLINITRREKKRKGKGEGRLGVAEKEVIEKECTGDPEFLKGIQWCIEQRAKLLNYDLPPAPPALALQINNTTNNEGGQTTTVLRKIVFKTRVTTAAPQVTREQEQ